MKKLLLVLSPLNPNLRVEFQNLKCLETFQNSKDDLKSEQFILFRSLIKYVRCSYIFNCFLISRSFGDQGNQEDEDGRDGAAGGEGRRWLGEN